MQLETLPDDEVADANDKKIQGVGIVSVLDDSPAAKAGVKEGTRVLAIEGKAVKN